MDALAAVSALCLHLLATGYTTEPPAGALHTCEDVGALAVAHGVPPVLALALAYTESRLDATAVSTRGARGPLQVLPAFHCPGGRLRGCDTALAGILALVRYRDRYRTEGWPGVLCHWNSGNRCYRRSRAFARIVLERAEALTTHGGGQTCGP